MDHKIFTLERNIRASPGKGNTGEETQNKAVYPIFYSGESPPDALIQFFKDHDDLRIVAEFLQPIIWVTHARTHYETTVTYVSDFRQATVRELIQRRDEEGRYLPGEEHKTAWDAVDALTARLAITIMTLVRKDLDRWRQSGYQDTFQET